MEGYGVKRVYVIIMSNYGTNFFGGQKFGVLVERGTLIEDDCF
jgi:hypothetical protein